MSTRATQKPLSICIKPLELRCGEIKNSNQFNFAFHNISVAARVTLNPEIGSTRGAGAGGGKGGEQEDVEE